MYVYIYQICQRFMCLLCMCTMENSDFLLEALTKHAQANTQTQDINTRETHVKHTQTLLGVSHVHVHAHSYADGLN